MSLHVGFRPCGTLDAQGRVIPTSYGDVAFLGDYGGSGTNLIYKGLARPGSSAANPVWQISKLTYDATDNLLSVQWPQNTNGAASNDYQFVWNSRATYTYS